MIREEEQSEGVKSSMRKTLIVSRRIGTAMIISAIALTAFIAYAGSRYELIPVVSWLIGAGSALITGVSAAKAYQSKAEQNDAASAL